MKFRYEYNKNYQTLRQFDEDSGKLVASMSMPAADLDKLSFLAWYMAVDDTHTEAKNFSDNKEKLKNL